jgi:hypothetical protein
MKTTNQNIDFSKNVKVSVDIQDLFDFGWELSDELESKETYHIDITVDDEGKTTWCLTNTQKKQCGIWEGSDSEVTGDDEQTIKDLEKLNSEGKLFNIITEYYGA